MSKEVNELSSQELELAHLYQAAQIGLCVTDTDHRYVRINQQLCDFNGKSIEEHVGRTIHEMIPHIADQIVSMFQSVIDSAKPILGHEVRGSTTAHSNEERIFLGDHYPLCSKDGKVLYVHTMVRDITKQRQAETLLKQANEELETRVKQRTAELENLSSQLGEEVKERKLAAVAARADEKHLRHLLESTMIIPWEADARTWKFTYVGPQAAFLGYPIDRWYDQDFWKNHVHPEDMEAAAKFSATKSSKGNNYDFEYRMIGADGREFWIHDLVSVDSAEGKPCFLRGFMIDITEQKRTQIKLKKSEETFRNLLQASPDGVVIVDRDGMILMTNEQMRRMFGYAEMELEGSSIEQLVPQDTRGKHQTYRSKYAHNPTTRPMGAVADLHGKRKDGSLFPVDICIGPMNLEGENVTACFVRDITGRKRLEEEERRLRVELTHISRVTAMGELVGSIAHELNQPLAAILANAQAALRFMKADNPNEQEIQEILQDIVSDDKRADQVIRRLRTLMQKHSANKESIQLDELVNELLPLIRNEAIAAKVEIFIEAAPNLPPVEADPIQLQQVIMNLLLNAIDAIRTSESAGGQICVVLSSFRKNSTKVAISDTGRGIPEENISEVFTAFYTTKPKGLGMGLSVCKTIIEAHEGTISVENLDPQGCCVSFILPLKSTTAL
ncbi:MAG: PAS domain S-box protein [Verrucomicrobia bacterium]|nr:PAS domain S-box protein [Verrucomicrobiota bacterium]